MTENDPGVAGYRADDRRDDEDEEGRPVTALALAIMWAERDARYAADKTALRPEQIPIIRNWRLGEAQALPRNERGKAGMAALVWYPPEHGQGAL